MSLYLVSGAACQADVPPPRGDECPSATRPTCCGVTTQTGCGAERVHSWLCVQESVLQRRCVSQVSRIPAWRGLSGEGGFALLTQPCAALSAREICAGMLFLSNATCVCVFV